jgi:hypothetical protein
MRSRFSWLLLIAAAGAGTAAAGQAMLAPCEAVNAQVESAAAQPEAFKGIGVFDYEALLAPVVQLPPTEHADEALWGKAMQLLGSDRAEVVEVQHVEGPVWRTDQMAGTANCEVDRFFSVREDGSLASIERVATFGNLCWNSWRKIGRVGGQVVLVELESQEHPALGLDVEITPWAIADRASCKVALRFGDTFRVTERFCKDASVCRAALPLAPKLAEALARAPDGKTLSSVAPPSPAAASALAPGVLELKTRLEADPYGYTPLQTFGGQPKTAYPTFTGSVELGVVQVADQTLIVRVGVGGVGWREIGDYLIVLYDGTAHPEAVASFVVERKSAGLQSVTTSVPQPFVASP